MLVNAESFPEQPAGAAARHGIADSSRGNHPKPRMRRFWQALPVGNEATHRQALPFPSHTRKIPGLLDSRSAPEAKALGRVARHAIP